MTDLHANRFALPALRGLLLPAAGLAVVLSRASPAALAQSRPVVAQVPLRAHLEPQ